MDGTASAPTELETALAELTRKSAQSPAALEPSDLAAVEALAGRSGAVEYAMVLAAFHFINRIADILEVPSEALPAPLRRFEWLRRGSVRIAAFLFRNMDLGNRRPPDAFAPEREHLEGLLAAAGTRLEPGTFDAFEDTPQVLRVFARAIEERDQRSGLDRSLIARIHAVVEDALPASKADLEGLRKRPEDPVDALAFVGTRYAYRTTQAMVDAVRAQGYSDRDVMDMAIAIADANQFARMRRLLALPANMYSLAGEAGRRIDAVA